MKNLVDNALIVIFTFIFSLLLNTGLDYFITHKGKINVEPPIAVRSVIYLPMTVTNYSSNTYRWTEN
jgi:hypothetical protein